YGRRDYGKFAADIAEEYRCADRNRILAGIADFRTFARARKGFRRRNDAHVQYGRRTDCGDSGSEIYTREEFARSGRREILCGWARCEGRSSGAVHMSEVRLREDGRPV